MPGPVTERGGNQRHYDFGFLWIARSAILVLPQTQNIAAGKISGFEKIREKIVYSAKLSGFKIFRIQSSHFKIRIQNLRRHDGMFSFLIRLLCVNGKTNPVLKRS